MTLQDFITESIKSIINGITEAQNFAKDKNALVNPTRIHDEMRKADQRWMWIDVNQDTVRPITKIDFDVAVVIANEENNQIGGGLNIQIFKATGQTKNSENNQTTSRISFSIDIALPNI